MSNIEKIFIKKVEKLTDEMLSAGKSGNWEALDQFESDRNTIITDFFDSVDLDGLSPVIIKSMIDRVLGIDHEIMSICSAEAGECQRQLTAYNYGHKAIAAYATNM